MARLKLSLWYDVVDDCNECLKLSPDNMKAHYYLAQAYSSLHEYESAVDHSLTAHTLCVQTDDKNLSAATALVLRCKKERWDATEKRRRREATDLETELLAMMQRERDEALRDMMQEHNDQDGDDNAGAEQEIAAEWTEKIAAMQAIFDKARAEDDRKRVIPDWAIDDITFNIMVDPVIVC